MPDTASTPDEDCTFSLSDTVFLAVITAAAYLFSFQYESSFLEYFGVPGQLAVVEIKTLIYVGVAMISLFISLIPILYLLLRLSPAQNPKALAAIFFWSLILAMTAAYIASYGLAEWSHWLFPATFALSLAISDISSYLFTRSRKRKAPEAHAAQAKKDLENYRKSYLSVVGTLLDLKGLRIASLILCAFVIVPSIGRYKARTQEEFLILEGAQPYIVIRTYGDTAIVVPLSAHESKLQKSFRIIKLGESTNALAFSLKKIGPFLSP